MSAKNKALAKKVGHVASKEAREEKHFRKSFYDPQRGWKGGGKFKKSKSIDAGELFKKIASEGHNPFKLIK